MHLLSEWWKAPLPLFRDVEVARGDVGGQDDLADEFGWCWICIEVVELEEVQLEADVELEEVEEGVDEAFWPGGWGGLLLLLLLVMWLGASVASLDKSECSYSLSSLDLNFSAASIDFLCIPVNAGK